MAIQEKTIAQLDGGSPGGATGAYVMVRYQDTNELVEYVEWANHMTRTVNASVTKAATGQVVVQAALQPVPVGQVNGSATLSGAQRFKLEEYNVSL